MNNKFNKISGITLISLVITIIVLIILAGVSISFINGNGNIIDETSKAKNNHDKSIYKEDLTNSVLLAMDNNNFEDAENSIIAKLEEFSAVCTTDGSFIEYCIKDTNLY